MTAHEKDYREYLRFAGVVVIVLIVNALVILAQYTAAKAATNPAPEAASVSSPVEVVADAPVIHTALAVTKAVCNEDMACWNCSTMGNFICGPKPARAAEAWKAFDPGVFTEAELSKPMTVTYRGTTSKPNNLPDGHEWYTIPVKGSKTLHHVFEVVFGR